MRTQGAETSKSMLPCKRRVHLHQSANFKMIKKMIQKWPKHPLKTHPKIDPEMAETSVKNTSNKWCGKSSNNIAQNTRNCQMMVPILEPVAWFVTVVARFVLRPDFQNLWGLPPWTDFGFLWGTLGSILSTCWKMFVQICSKIQRFKGNKWHQPHLQKNK